MPSADYLIPKYVTSPAIVRPPDSNSNAFHSSDSIRTRWEQNKPPTTSQLPQRIDPVLADYCQYGRCDDMTSQITPVMMYFSILQRKNLADGLKFIGCFSSIFHNLWTVKIHHDARCSAVDNISHGDVISVSYKMISTGCMNGFSDEVEHKNAAKDLYSYDCIYNAQRDDCRKAI